MCDGKVDLTYPAGNYSFIAIMHTCSGRKITAYYAHLNPQSFKVKKGDNVKEGEAIAYLANYSDNGGKHLHLTIENGHEPSYTSHKTVYCVYNASTESLKNCSTTLDTDKNVKCTIGWGWLTCYYSNSTSTYSKFDKDVYIRPESIEETFGLINPASFLEELYSGIKENTNTTDNIPPAEEASNPTTYNFDLSHLSIYSGEEFDKRYTFYVSESFKNAQCEIYVPRHNTENDKLIIDENATTEVKFDNKWYTMYRLKLYAPGKIYNNVSALSVSDPNTYTVTIKCQKEVANPIFWVVPNTIDIKPVVNEKVTSNNNFYNFSICK